MENNKSSMKATETYLILCQMDAGEITLKEAHERILRLFDVSGSFTAYDMERAYDDGYSTEGEVTFDIENYR